MDILENGLHSFNNAVLNFKKLETASQREREYIIKEALIGLHHSTETLFKYLVKEKLEILIYKDLNDYFTKKTNHILDGNDGDSMEFQSNTINFMEAINRVVVLYKLKLSISEYRGFKRLNELRNFITHHEYDLTEDPIKFLLPQVLKVVFPIYNKNLPNFPEYAAQHSLDITGTSQVYDFQIWSFIRHFTLLKKFFNSKQFLETYKEDNNKFNSHKKKKNQETKKELFIEFHECPCCKETFFKKEHVYIEAAEEVMYYGHCLLCNLLLDKDDAHYIQMTYGSYDSFLKLFKTDLSILKDLMYDEGLAFRITPEDASAINTFLDDDEINTFLVEYIENIFDKALFDILEDECYSLNYDASELDEAVAWNKELEVREVINHIDEFDISQIKQMVTNCTVLHIKPEISNTAFKNAIEQEFVMNTYVGHHYPHTNEDVTVDVKITFEIDPSIFIEFIMDNEFSSRNHYL
ncbi:hypothetical protein [Bacillus mycoides]|uniref:hypothetical protein n=1 Tax=Bacillus mycoides TaxID=1405 RepID=UPI0010BF1B45|nr:hypothetical protein [Bacillus mycoides]TKI39924.1 hypothetical protein FC700_20930 [Bacillus mycoides]